MADLLTWTCMCMAFVALALSPVWTAETKKPNIVFVLTDDQDVVLFGQNPMPKTKKLLTDQGMMFQNMFVSSPLCCPSRASILSGQFVHNHKTFNNSLNGGCSSASWQNNTEPKAFVTYLKAEGYNTFFAGKYLNQYGKKSVGGVEHVPPGWDEWNGLVGNSVYYNYSLSVDGKEEKHGKNYTEDYLTDLIHRRGVDFLSKQSEEKPFFMMLSTPACHSPFTPAPQYEDLYKDEKAPRTKSFNTHGKDKHWLVESAPSPMADDVVKMVDNNYRQRHRTLLSVDDMIEGVYNKLNSMKLLNNTYIFFSSDNGYHLGQFSLPFDKRQPYEFDIRVPLIVRGPGIKPNTVSDAHVMSIDLAPTFVNMAGADIPPQFDGMDLEPLLHPKSHAELAYETSKKSSDNFGFTNLLSSIGRNVLRFSQESPLEKLAPFENQEDAEPAKPFRSSVLVEYFGEAQDSMPDCPKLDHNNVYESVTNVDLAPTFVDLAGSTEEPLHFDGMSFASLLHSQTHRFRSTVLVEYYGEEVVKMPECPQLSNQHLRGCFKRYHCFCQDSKNNTYGCIRYETDKQSFKFCEFQDTANSIEVYDLKGDPEELNNIAKSAPPELLSKLTNKLAKLSLCKGKGCHDNTEL